MKRKEKLIRSIEIIFLLISASAFLFLVQKSARLIEVNEESFAALSGVLMGMGILAFMMSLRKGTEGIADIFAMLFSAGAAYYAVSLISTESFSLFTRDSKLNPLMHLYGFLSVVMIYLALFAIIGNAKPAMVLGNATFTVFALGNNLCYTFRERPLTYADLGAWKETLNIAGEGYAPDFDEKVYCGIALMAAAAAFIIFFMLIAASMREEKTQDKRKFIGKRAFSPGVLLSRVLCLAAAALLYNTMYSGNFLKEQNINKLFFDVSPIRESPFLDFCCSVKNVKLKKPEGYSPGTLSAEREKIYEPENLKVSQKPNIIVVMSEAYSDMRDLDRINTNINPYGFFDWLRSVTRWGKLYVSDCGGGTANTEFQFLTGCDTAFFPTGLVPYNWYVQSEYPSLFSTLKAHGYDVLTVHPYLKTFWNREKVYKYYGLEESYWDKDFKNPEKIRGYISDRANYEFIIKRFKKKEPGKPLFVFNVTMQNHGPYKYGLNMGIKLRPENKSPQLEEYLNLIRVSGEETRRLIDHFRYIDEPTIIVFFGDHRPAVDRDFYKEYEESFKKEADVSVKTEKKSAVYMTDYYIWANFDFEPGQAENISVNFLQGELLEFAGLEAPTFINFQQETLRKKWPVIVKSGCRRGDGAWFEFGVPELWEDEDIKKYYAMQYNLISDIRSMRADIFYLYRD